MSFQVSYAQNREDYIINAFFPDIKQGFYIDIGANDPDEDSVTKLFYQKGWNGINIEPLEDKYRLLKDKRTRDVNLQLGLSDKAGELTFRKYKGHGLSTFSNEVKEEHTQHQNNNVEDFEDQVVAVTTLKDIQATHKVRHVHFMKIDVEGFEYEVLQGNDWKKYRPELICIEANHIKNDWRPFLVAQKYTEVFNDGLNAYYIRNESKQRAEQFSYANHMLAGPQIIKWTVEKEFDLIKQSYENSIAALGTEIDSLHKKHRQLYEIHKTIEYKYTESLQLKKLLKNTARKILGRNIEI